MANTTPEKGRIKVKVRLKEKNAQPEPAVVKPRRSVRVDAQARKTTFTRTDLPNGDFMMNYYYRRDERGELVPEDIHSATHFERVVYDRDGNTIGSMNGMLSDTLKW